MEITRKQIIELIEPFMDKTLSKGCLYNKFDYISVLKETNINNREELILIGATYNSFNEFNKYIIGHYDITAVLKYIRSNNHYIKDEIDFLYIEENFSGEEKGKIPNKPLHLYSTDEDKNLLELLQKIGMK